MGLGQTLSPLSVKEKEGGTAKAGVEAVKEEESKEAEELREATVDRCKVLGCLGGNARLGEASGWLDRAALGCLDRIVRLGEASG